MTRPQIKGLPEFGRCAVFAILNVTPDSFSDGGVNLPPDAAIALDPGLGFAKNAEHDWALLRGQERLQRELGRPLLIGHSRKRFLGALLADERGVPRPAGGRDAATLAVAAVAAARGAWAVRVHAG